jgi:hypothetical protein
VSTTTRRRLAVGLTAGAAIAGMALVPLTARATPATARAHSPQVLTVGTFHGVTGEFRTIQNAVNHARPGDTVLIAPGDYHEHATSDAGVLIRTPNLHLVGMNRNAVVVDGTKMGAPVPCAKGASWQVDSASGRNGILIDRVSGVTVSNLTVCNFLTGSVNGDGGNEVWWNGGDATGTIGMGSWHGSYLTATSTFYTDQVHGQYGLFASNASGPGRWYRTYASNMVDSSYYVGACRTACNATLDHVRAQNSALGYSGTNAGGRIVIQHSVFDHNRVGLAPNSLNNDDAPPPQDGSCPGHPGTPCLVIRDNLIANNNQVSSPGGWAPIGVGVEIAGGRFDQVVHNVIRNQKSWGILVNDFPDYETPPAISTCQGALADFPLPPPLGTVPCYFPAFGNQIRGNVMADNGGYGHFTNGDLAEATAAVARSSMGYVDGNCWVGNVTAGGDPAAQYPALSSTCGKPNAVDGLFDNGGLLLAEVGCASVTALTSPSCDALAANVGESPYPTQTVVTLFPRPTHLATRPDVCASLPAGGRATCRAWR